MSKPTAVTKQTHSDKSWARFTSYSFAAETNLVAIVAAEIAKAVHAFPMGFVKTKDSFRLVAVLSLKPGTNLFVAPNGQWLGSYIPSAFRSHPFLLADSEKTDAPILCVDQDSGLIREDTSAEAFFDEQGELSQPVAGILDFLSQIEQNRKLTNQAVSVLADVGVIVEWPLKIKQGDKESPITGLYMIDEQKLNSLEDELFITLRKAGALPVAYAQVLSMSNVQVFEQLAKIQEQNAEKTSPAPDTKDFLGDDDVIIFD
jgi:hypothetical protein